MPFHTEYRPRNFEEIIGNKGVKDSLTAIFARDDKPHAFLFQGPSGCVDNKTQFMTEFGWKYISDYVEGDSVLQYNIESEKATLTKDAKYIKRKSEIPMFHFHTKYGLDQCLSDDHRTYYFSRRGLKYTVPFKTIREKHTDKTKSNFEGTFLTSFNISNNTKFQLSDELLRVQVMVIADSHILETRKKCELNLTKKRKINRAIKLLNNANISFSMNAGYQNDNTIISFIPPLRIKKYTNDFYKCSNEQLKIICDEVLLWDGTLGNRFDSTEIKSAEFIQYAFAATNKRASINYYDKDDNKRYYRVIISNNNKTGLGGTEIKEYQPEDGYQYCFTVPDSYLVLRRKGCIFITGNCGKTTFARIIKDMLGCSDKDYMEINAANNRGIDTAREILNSIRYNPIDGPVKIVMIDEVGATVKTFQEALLKPLEDTPDHVYFIFCTTDPNLLKKTLRNRCTTFEVKKLNDKEMYDLIHWVIDEQNINLHKDIIELITDQSDGCARQALVILDQIVDLESEDMENAISQIHSEEQQVKMLCQALMKDERWSNIAKIIKNINGEPEATRRAILGYMSAVVLNGGKTKHEKILECFLDPYYDSGKAGLIVSCWLSSS